MSPLQHRLLVAAPNLGDPNFERTVVFILEHNEAGAVGLVLNRPSGTTVEEHLPGLGELVGDPAAFFIGGPVEIGGLLALGRVAAGAEVDVTAWAHGDVAVIEPDRVVNQHLDGVTELRVYTGYAGWSEGQLEAELRSGGWLVAEPDDGDLLTADPDGLWRAVLRRQAAPTARLAMYPDDVRVN